MQFSKRNRRVGILKKKQNTFIFKIFQTYREVTDNSYVVCACL